MTKHRTGRQLRKAHVHAILEVAAHTFDIQMESIGFSLARENHFAILDYTSRKYGMSRDHIYAIAEMIDA
jgi:hypothetical protein